MCGLLGFMKSDYGSFVLVILIGVVMAVGVLVKLLVGFDIDSDWFWFLTGVGLSVQGVVSFRSRLKFDKKHKVVPKK